MSRLVFLPPLVPSTHYPRPDDDGAHVARIGEPYPALHVCLACGRHPSTHAPAGPDSYETCPMCGLGDERSQD